MRKLYYNPIDQKFYVSNAAISGFVPTNIDPNDIPYVSASEYQEEEDGQLVTKYAFAVDEGTKAQATANELARQEAYAAYLALNNEIIQDAAQVAGTTNQISAILDLITYQRMSDKPELFDGEGLVAKKTVGDFTQGQALNTELKIKQYAEAMLAETDQFMIRRMKAITDYILS